MSEERGNELIVLVILLNSADAVFTSLAIEMGLSEMNPLMAAILQSGMQLFLFDKLIVVNSMILFLGMFGRDYHIGRIGMAVAAWTYTFLVFYHMVNLSLLCVIGS